MTVTPYRPTPAERMPTSPYDWEAGIIARTGRAAADLSALPDIANITIMAGMDYRLFLTVHGEDLTGRVFAAQIRDQAGGILAGEWVTSLSGEDAGTIVLDLTAATTLALPPLSRYDVWLCDFPRTPLLAGMITTEPGITECGPTG